MYPRSLDNKSWYCNSEQDPVAIIRKRLNSGIDSRPHPSAMLVGIDAADRLICDTSEYNSSLGKDLVAL